MLSLGPGALPGGDSSLSYGLDSGAYLRDRETAAVPRSIQDPINGALCPARDEGVQLLRVGNGKNTLDDGQAATKATWADA